MDDPAPLKYDVDWKSHFLETGIDALAVGLYVVEIMIC